MQREAWSQQKIVEGSGAAGAATATLDVSADVPAGVKTVYLAWVQVTQGTVTSAALYTTAQGATPKPPSGGHQYEYHPDLYDPPIPFLVADGDVVITLAGNGDVTLTACFVW